MEARHRRGAAFANGRATGERGGHRGRRAEPNAGAGTPEVRPHRITRNTGRAQCARIPDPCNKATTEVTRMQMSNVPALDGLHGPMGQFINVKRYPPADYRGVSAPNADTLYSVAWLDLAAEPTVFSHPD